MDKAISDLYEPLIRRVTSVGGDMTTDEATAMLDAIVHGIADFLRSQDFGWYEDDATGALMARDHLADRIDPEQT